MRTMEIEGQPKIAAVILTFNQREKTLRCLDSLFKSVGIQLDILLWDNGSSDATIEAVTKQYPQVVAIYSPTNLGVASGRNAAAEAAVKCFNPTYLLFLDNDLLFETGFVEGLYRPFLEDRTVGQTQAKLRFMHQPDRLNDGGGCDINFILARTRPVGFGEIDHGQHDDIKTCVSCGGAMMVKSDLFNLLGGFDKAFDPFGPEDLDFSLRLAKAGYKAIYTPQAIAYHEVSHTYGGNYNEGYARHKTRHWLTFLHRHASLSHQVGFFLIGAPYLAVRIFIREGKKGNWGAFRGLLRGMFDQQ
jgi:GT2 family glycosyltransferase